MVPFQTTPVHRLRSQRLRAGRASHFARQIDAAHRLAPCEPYRGHAALLLSCGDADGLEEAEVALRDAWSPDAVHRLHCPLPSWEIVSSGARGASSWLGQFITRALAEHDPSLVALLDRPGRAGPRSAVAQALVARLRGWGVTCPIAVVRVAEDGEVAWHEDRAWAPSLERAG